MKTLILISIFTLPGLSELMTSIDDFWNRELDARIQQFEANEKKPFLKFLPSIGIGYNLQGQPRPTINFSVNRVYDALQEKEIRRVNKEGIIREIELLKQQNKIEVQELFLNHQDQLRLFDFQKEQAKIDSILFSFVEKQYNQPVPEIPPSEYFQKKKNYLSVQANLLTGEMRLKELERQILSQAHFFTNINFYETNN